MCKFTTGKNLPFFLLAALVFASCASSPSPRDDTSAKTQSSTPPQWVVDKEKEYPNSEWLCIVAEEQNTKLAENAAVTGLAQAFRVDLNSVSSANRQLAEVIGTVKKKAYVTEVQSTSMSLDMTATSAVSGLIGVQVESWANPRSNRAHANARMNRKECSARYSAMIRENEKVIQSLKDEADRNPATFDAYQLLNLAYAIALVTDNYYSLLTVLDPSTISKQPSYGNAEAVKSLARVAGQAIVVTIKVTGDINDRIAKAYSECLTSRGFKTNTGGANSYLLDVTFTLEDVDLQNPNKFVRYLLNCSLKNKAGLEILSSSENGREGHATQSEARQRAIRTAENAIKKTDNKDGFAANFDAFLASLL